LPLLCDAQTDAVKLLESTVTTPFNEINFVEEICNKIFTANTFWVYISELYLVKQAIIFIAFTTVSSTVSAIKVTTDKQH